MENGASVTRPQAVELKVSLSPCRLLDQVPSVSRREKMAVRGHNGRSGIPVQERRAESSESLAASRRTMMDHVPTRLNLESARSTASVSMQNGDHAT